MLVHICCYLELLCDSEAKFLRNLSEPAFISPESLSRASPAGWEMEGCQIVAVKLIIELRENKPETLDNVSIQHNEFLKWQNHRKQKWLLLMDMGFPLNFYQGNKSCKGPCHCIADIGSDAKGQSHHTHHKRCPHLTGHSSEQ